jgi:hypothetical protein
MGFFFMADFWFFLYLMNADNFSFWVGVVSLKGDDLTSF